MANTQPSKAKLTTLAMVQIALCTALICVSAQLAIPLPIGVPFTLLILKPLYSVISLLLYVLLGVVGLPVFSGAKSGIGTILSPTGGFIIGFVLAAFFVSLLKGVLGRKLGGKLTVVRYIIVTVIIGIPVMYIPGIALYMVYTGADLVSAIVTLTSVFILLDIAKCVIASLIAVPLNKALAKIY